MRDIAFTLLIFGALPIILWRPWIGVLVFAWLSLMTPYRFAFGFAYDFPFAAVVAACTLLGLLVTKDEVRYEPSLGLVLLIALPAWTCVTNPGRSRFGTQVVHQRDDHCQCHRDRIVVRQETVAGRPVHQPTAAASRKHKGAARRI